MAYGSSIEHLDAELAWLELVLRHRMLLVRARRGTSEPFDEFSGMYVSEEELAGYATERSDAARVDGRAARLADQITAARADIDARLEASAGRGDALRLPRLARRFGLGPAHVRVLVCCIAPDWDLRFQRYFAYLQNDVSRRRPTMQMLGDLLGETVGDGSEGTPAIRALLSPDAPLLRERLLTIGAADLPWPARQPAVAEAVSDYLAGAMRPDGALSGVARIMAPRVTCPSGGWYERHRDITATLAVPLGRDGRFPTAYLSGRPGSGTSLIAAAVATLAGVRLMRVDCRAWVASRAMTHDAVRLLRRDAIMHGCVVELERCEALLDAGATDARLALDEFLLANDGAGIILTGTAPAAELTSVLDAPVWSFEIPAPTFAERADLWTRELAAGGHVAEPECIEALATGFRFLPREMHRAVEQYEASRGDAPGAVIQADAMMRVCRDTSRRTMHRFARHVVPRRGWTDLVLPDDSRLQLLEICAAARGRRRVHDDWGFAHALSLGAGLNVLFAGPSGVGKTMSAEIVAGDLGLDLFATDLSAVVSKYIGETEKNLSVVFDEAERTNCVLFFDECDALFGKRTEIKDAHDRYANIEVSYLLQRIDEYEGIVILATNLRSNLDAAFTRRIRYAVEFPFPEAEHREQIWRRVFPGAAPLGEDVDLEFLARQFKLTGGSIANIAVNAAFLAASNGGRVGMKHVIHATRRELQKMGKSCTKAEFGKYFPWVRDTSPVAAGAIE